MALGIKPVEIIQKEEYPLLVKAPHWERVNLSLVAKVQNGFAFKSDFFDRATGMPLIRIRDIAGTETEHRYFGDFDSSYLVRTGDILVGMDGDFKAARWQGGEALLNQRVCRLTLTTDLYDSKFLFICLQPYLNAINAETSSVTVKHLSSHTLEELPLPLPPLNEQKRIVAELEEMFSELDKGIESLKTGREQLKAYRQAILKYAFEGKLTERWRSKTKSQPNIQSYLEEIGAETYAETLPTNLPKNWTYAKSGSLFSFITSGSRGWAKYYSDTGAIFIRIGNLDFDTLTVDFSDIQHVIPPKDSEGLRTKVQEGDFLISITGYLGMFAIAPKLKDAYVNQHIALARPKDGFCREYLGYYIISKSGGHHYLNALTKGAVKAGLGLDDIKNFPVPLCPLSEQKEVVAQIRTKLSVVDKLETEFDQMLVKSSILRQALLKKAFSGRLVPQNPKDESANILLERIRQNKVMGLSVKRKKSPAKKTPGLQNIYEGENFVQKILDALNKERGWISTSDLSKKLGINPSSEIEAIEAFYSELRETLLANAIMIERRKNEDWIKIKKTQAA